MLPPLLGSVILGAWLIKGVWQVRLRAKISKSNYTSPRAHRGSGALHLSLIVPGQRSLGDKKQRAGPKGAPGRRRALGR